MANYYEYGNTITIAGAYDDENEAPYDPTTVYVWVKNPNGTDTTYEYGVDVEVVKDSTGRYSMDVSGNIVGIWYYRWYTDNPDDASDEKWFEVTRIKTI